MEKCGPLVKYLSLSCIPDVMFVQIRQMDKRNKLAISFTKDF